VAELTIAGHSRPFPGEEVSGDTWFSITTEASTRIVVIDGAGHGPLANHAATVAADVLRDNAHLSAEQALGLCHTRLYGTRGAVISIADIQGDKLRFVGVGNVDLRLITPTAQQRLVPNRGLLGASLPKIHPWTLTLEPDWRLLMFSDGIKQRMTHSWEDLANLEKADGIVAELISYWGRDTDDATIVLIGPGT